MGLRDYLKQTNEKAKANAAEAKRRHGIEPEPDIPEPTTLTKQYVSERQYQKDAVKLADEGWYPETINNQGKPGWSKVLGGPMVNERLEVTYTKSE